jgi:hypothetical protein
MGATITLLNIKDGDCIGGFTKVEWSSDNNSMSDNNAILFNLSCYRNYPSKGRYFPYIGPY